MVRFLDEMRLKTRLDSKKFGYRHGKADCGHEYRSGIETLCANSNSQFARPDLILK
jgi:hypothetical protein